MSNQYIHFYNTKLTLLKTLLTETVLDRMMKYEFRLSTEKIYSICYSIHDPVKVQHQLTDLFRTIQFKNPVKNIHNQEIMEHTSEE